MQGSSCYYEYTGPNYCEQHDSWWFCMGWFTSHWGKCADQGYPDCWYDKKKGTDEGTYWLPDGTHWSSTGGKSMQRCYDDNDEKTCSKSHDEESCAQKYG